MQLNSGALEKIVFPPGLAVDAPLNLLSIFGAARQGKSFLMNLLAGQQDLFKISNAREPCTQGVDISSHVTMLADFERKDPEDHESGDTMPSDDIGIGFIDAEGQGDRDISYDTRLIPWYVKFCSDRRYPETKTASSVRSCNLNSA